MYKATGLALRFVWMTSGLQVISFGCGEKNFRTTAGTAAQVSDSQGVPANSSTNSSRVQSIPDDLTYTNSETTGSNQSSADSLATSDSPVVVHQSTTAGVASSEGQGPEDKGNSQGSGNSLQNGEANGATTAAGAEAGSGSMTAPTASAVSGSTTNAPPAVASATPQPQTSTQPQLPVQNPNESRLERQERLCASNTQKSRRVKVMVPKNNGAKCPWANGDNFPKDDGKISARIERKFPIDIPKEHVVCGFKAEAKEQMIRYDDHLFVTINDFVVASRANIVSEFELKDNQFKQYDWRKIRGRQANDLPNPFCAKGVVCDVPRTENNGRFFFEFNNQSSQRLFSSIGQDSPFLNIIITGDNNEPQDCQITTDIEFIVDYDFVSE
jgi:hypothetical protein